MYAVEDYTSTEEGGLSFNRGDRVYVLLRNRGGVCTGWWCAIVFSFVYYSMILLPKEYYRYTLYVIGMSRGRYGTFLETAVGSSAPSTGNYSLQNTMQ